MLCTMGWHALQHGPIIGALGREAWRLMNEFVISAFPPRFGMPPGALRTRLKKPLTLSSREHRSSRETQTTLEEGGVVLYFSPSVRPEQTIAGGGVLT